MSVSSLKSDPKTRLLTADDITHFHQHGYVLIRGVFQADELTLMAQAFDHMNTVAQAEIAKLGTITASTVIRVGCSRVTIQPDRGAPLGASIRHIAWCSGMSEDLRRIGRDARLRQFAAQLLRSDTMHHIINQAHFKLPGSEVKFDWHQDSVHRGMHNGNFTDLNGTGSYVQTAIAIDPITNENGPLAIIPGSNHRGHLPHEPTKLRACDVDEAAAIRPELDPGDVLLFGPYTIHGSQPNCSKIARRSFLNGFAYPGATLRTYASQADGEGEIISR